MIFGIMKEWKCHSNKSDNNFSMRQSDYRAIYLVLEKIKNSVRKELNVDLAVQKNFFLIADGYKIEGDLFKQTTDIIYEECINKKKPIPKFLNDYFWSCAEADGQKLTGVSSFVNLYFKIDGMTDEQKALLGEKIYQIYEYE